MASFSKLFTKATEARWTAKWLVERGCDVVVFQGDAQAIVHALVGYAQRGLRRLSSTVD